MRIASPISLFVVSVFVYGNTLRANDGRDRHRQATATQFELFPEAIDTGSGYRFLSQDGPGGVDGTEMFRWARPTSISLVKVAAFETVKALGEAPFPMAIFDLTSENGDTPVTMQPNIPPRGRHPGGSHDGGLNMDLGYYLKSDKGLKFNPDLAACSNHFEAPTAAVREQKDASQCLGPADKLSVPHEAYFLLTLVRINRESFGRDLIEEIGIDWEARKLVTAQIAEWVKAKAMGATPELQDDLARVFTSDAWDGWSTSHHHHVHLRLRDLSTMRAHREAFETLEARDKINTLALLRKKTPKDQKFFLRLRLLSSGLSRAIDAELLGAEGEGKGLSVSFQNDGGTWQKQDPSRFPRLSATWDIPDGFNEERSEAVVKAEVLKNGQTLGTLSQSLPLPRKPFYLCIAVDPAQIRGRIERDRARRRLVMRIDYPQPYATYITHVSYRITYANQDPSEAAASGTPEDDFSFAAADGPQNAIKDITALIQLSGRMTLSVPIYNAAQWKPIFN